MEAGKETDKSDEASGAGTAPENQTVSESGSTKVVNAHTFIRLYKTFSKPVALMCDDGCAYVVKARQNGKPAVDRAIINDHLVARIGIMLGAPIPEIALVNVPPELISSQAEMKHMEPGKAHGSLFVNEITERKGIQHFEIPQNRNRFAILAVLYGWVGANDHQFYYAKSAPYLVYSVDHGHFFPGGPQWTKESLERAPTAVLDPTLSKVCNFSGPEVHEATKQLENVGENAVANVVAVIPSEWTLPQDEREALRKFLIRRREELLTKI